RAALDHPALDRAVFLRDVDVQPRLRVDPLELHDHALARDGLVAAELRRERMARECGCRGEHESGPGRDAQKRLSHNLLLLFLPIASHFVRVSNSAPRCVLVTGILDQLTSVCSNSFLNLAM